MTSNDLRNSTEQPDALHSTEQAESVSDELKQRAKRVEKLAKDVSFTDPEDTIIKQNVVPPAATRPVDPMDLKPSRRFGEAMLDKIIWLKFEFGEDKRSAIKIEIEKDLILGRASQDTDTQPDLDLTPYGAAFHGVSRRHLKIMKREHSLHIMDLGSTNGTYLNGAQLYAGQPRVLREGDELRLGTLVVGVFFEHSTAKS